MPSPPTSTASTALRHRQRRSAAPRRKPGVRADEQIKALTAVLDKVGISGLAGNFLKAVAANRRLFAVQDILRGYRARVARHRARCGRR